MKDAIRINEEAQPPDPLVMLHKVLTDIPSVPKIGEDAARRIRDCFGQTAADVERLASEAVERAEAILAEARQFAVVLRDAGEMLAGKIETESARGAQIATIMRSARSLMDQSSGPETPVFRPPGNSQ